MKKWILIIVITIAIIFGLYKIVFDYAIPESAKAFIPNRWKLIALGKSSTAMSMYLGKPIDTVILEKGVQHDWIFKRNEHAYELKAKFNISSSLYSYEIYFHYNGIIKRVYLLKTGIK